MNSELIAAISNAPVVVVLIYLIIRMQAEKEKLIASIIESERQHAKDILSLVCGDRVPHSYAPSPTPDKGENRQFSP